MGYVKNIHDDFLKLFNAAQESSGCHQKAAAKLKSFYDLVAHHAFFSQFKKLTDAILVIDSKIKNPYVDRSMEFIALFCFVLKQAYDESVQTNSMDTEEVSEHPFVSSFMEYILGRQNVINFSIRLRSCQLINKILDHLVGTDLSTEFCDQIEESMLERLNDPKLEVRLEGILALHRFQDKRNPLDRIIDMLKILMEQDRFAKVRRLCVEKIALREDVVPILLRKIRDVDIGVRLAAFIRLSKIPGALKIEHRRLILKCGSLDTADKIKYFVENSLLPNWLLYSQNSFHCLMKAVRLDANENDVKETNELCEFILKTLFKSTPLDVLMKDIGVSDENKLIPYENLNWESCNYWRILVQYVRKQFDEQVDQILPELVHFCSYIKGFCDNLPDVETTTDFLQNQFILKQLFTITKGYDIADPTGRSALSKLVKTVLSDVILTLDTVEVIVSNLEPIIPNVELRARFINELISDIATAEDFEEIVKAESDYKEKMADLKQTVKLLNKHQEEAIAIKDYSLAGSLVDELRQVTSEISILAKEKISQQNEVPVKKQDIATLIKYLDVAAGLLLSPQVTKMTSSLEILKSNTIFELMIHENETVQSKALHCYALFCLIDLKTASDGIHLFFAPISAYQSGQECDIQILLVCIGAIVDVLRIYGTQLIAAPEENPDLSESQREDNKCMFFGGTSLTKIIQALVDCLDDEQIAVQENAGRGLCSLILSNTIQSSQLLTRLVLKWCNPYDESQKLKQLIGFTLQELPRRIFNFQNQWENAIITTLRSIVYASGDSPFSDVNVEEIAKFMIALYQVSLENSESLINFAMRVCSEIKKKPRAKQIVILSKILTMLNVPKDSPFVDELTAICDEVRDVTNNRLVTANIVKFLSKLNQNRRNNRSRRVTTQDIDYAVADDDDDAVANDDDGAVADDDGGDSDEEMQEQDAAPISMIMEED